MKWSGWRWLIATAARLGRRDRREQPGQRPLAEVEQDVRVAERHEVARAGRAGTIGVGRAGPEDREPHPSLLRVPGGYRRAAGARRAVARSNGLGLAALRPLVGNRGCRPVRALGRRRRRPLRLGRAGDLGRRVRRLAVAVVGAAAAIAAPPARRPAPPPARPRRRAATAAGAGARAAGAGAGSPAVATRSARAARGSGGRRRGGVEPLDDLAALGERVLDAGLRLRRARGRAPAAGRLDGPGSRSAHGRPGPPTDSSRSSSAAR